MSATQRRPGGSHKSFHASRRLSSDDVARRLEGLAAQPPASLLPAAPAPGRIGRAATWMIPLGLGLLAIAAAAVFMSGCNRAAAGTSNDDQDCSQAAVRLSARAAAPRDVSTEGGGLGLTGRESDVTQEPLAGRTATAGGTASKPESTGAGRVVRDRRGLVDAWPEAHTSSCTSRPVPGSPVAAPECDEEPRGRRL